MQRRADARRLGSQNAPKQIGAPCWHLTEVVPKGRLLTQRLENSLWWLALQIVHLPLEHHTALLEVLGTAIGDVATSYRSHYINRVRGGWQRDEGRFGEGVVLFEARSAEARAATVGGKSRHSLLSLDVGVRATVSVDTHFVSWCANAQCGVASGNSRIFPTLSPVSILRCA